MQFRLTIFLVLLAVAASAQQISPASFQDLRWRMIGPFRGGRTHAVAGVGGPPMILYIAPVNGGVWRSDDAGRSWKPIFDAAPRPAVGAIAVAPGDAHVLCVGS